jgi:hypothetical protein
MDNLVLIEEERIRASPDAVFGLFGRCPEGGWLFGSALSGKRDPRHR